MSVGAFLIGVFKVSDAFHIFDPLLSNTPLTAWVMAPLYALGHGLVFLGVEIFNKRKALKNTSEVLDK